jgi:CheY-like chemotaxis protein
MCLSRRVLVVEDTTVVRTLLEAVLTDEGYRVYTAANGAVALGALEVADPCVILLDLRMPVMDGLAFAQAYRQSADANALIIVMTAERRRDEIAEIAPVEVVLKPFDTEALLLTVEHWVQVHTAESPAPQPINGKVKYTTY